MRYAPALHPPLVVPREGLAPAGSQLLRPAAARLSDEAVHSAGWYWQTNSRHRITHLFGSTLARSALGKAPWEVPGVDTRHAGWIKLFDAMMARQPFVDAVWLRRDGQGCVHYCMVSGEPVFGPKRRFVGFRGIGRMVDNWPPA